MNTKIYCRKDEPIIGSLCGIVTVPSDYKPGEEKLPLIVFLHGAGEVGNGTAETVEKVCVHGIPTIFCNDPDYHGLRVITASPQCIDGLVWDQITLQLMDWIAHVVKEYNVDENRISITGLSMGGYGTWNLFTTYPEYFYRVAPVCGGGISWRLNERHKGKELRTFHSVDDTSVPYLCTVDMVTKARQAGVNVQFTTYTDKGHCCWNSAYGETDLIEWLAGTVD